MMRENTLSIMVVCAALCYVALGLDRDVTEMVGLSEATAHLPGEGVDDDDDFLGEGEDITKAQDTVAAEATSSETKKADEKASDAKSLAPSYEDGDLKRIAQAKVTPIPKSFNGSMTNITKGGKAEEMAMEYQNATRQQAADKDNARIEGNKNIAKFANGVNAKIKANNEREYKMKVQITNTSLMAFRKKWVADTARDRIAHAAGCKNLTKKNPYPKNSSQYKAVAIACNDQDPKMSTDQNNTKTAVDAGSDLDKVVEQPDITRHRHVNQAYGPHAKEPLVNATEVADVTAELAAQNKPKELEDVLDDAADV